MRWLKKVSISRTYSGLSTDSAQTRGMLWSPIISDDLILSCYYVMLVIYLYLLSG